ncbi:hypothetical protein KEM52_004591 [Ascosphaera acerosa]|nr:hypothetical protein KEM52_004591 [Ascosphaera acerosa]
MGSAGRRSTRRRKDVNYATDPLRVSGVVDDDGAGGETANAAAHADGDEDEAWPGGSGASESDDEGSEGADSSDVEGDGGGVAEAGAGQEASLRSTGLLEEARDLWLGAMDVTFPSRRTLDKLLSGPASDDPLSHYEEQMAKEATAGWDWYYVEPAGTAFRSNQQLSVIQADDAVNHLPPPQNPPMGVLVGPWKAQKYCTLQVGDALDFGTAFTDRCRQGWILNLGSKVQCLSWCPNVRGSTQYLAVAVPVHDGQLPQDQQARRHGNAFSASAPHPAAIQIWAFAASPSDKPGVRGLDMSTRPKVLQVICTKAGDIRRNLGLLGGVWSDGTVKIIDVSIQDSFESEREYVFLESSAFEAQTPNAVCTCFAWLSPSSIVVGHSDGSIAVWDISSASSRIEPTLLVPVHTTFITNVEPAYPTRPDLIVTMAMDGQMRLMSLTDTKADVVDPARARLVSPCMAYSPLLMSFMACDELDLLRLFPIRRFNRAMRIGRTYSPMFVIAPGSMHHPSALYANTGGTVFASNPLFRVLGPGKGGKLYQQIWFSHTWAAPPGPPAPAVATDARDMTGSAAAAGTYAHSGTVRFVDGFKAETPALTRGATVEAPQSGFCTTNMTIFEEKTAVTALGWNPNRDCAAWAAAAAMKANLLLLSTLLVSFGGALPTDPTAVSDDHGISDYVKREPEPEPVRINDGRKPGGLKGNAKREPEAEADPEPVRIVNGRKKGGLRGNAKREPEAEADPEPVRIVNGRKKGGLRGNAKREPEAEADPEPVRITDGRKPGGLKGNAKREPEADPEPVRIVNGRKPGGLRGNAKREPEANPEPVRIVDGRKPGGLKGNAKREAEADPEPVRIVNGRKPGGLRGNAKRDEDEE